MRKRIRFLKYTLNFTLIFTLGMTLVFASVLGEAADVEKVELNLIKGEIAFTFLELSDGEASLIQTGDGKNILINSGGLSSENELLDRLEMFDVLQIDAFIMTKDDPSHNSNLDWVFESYMINEVIVSKSYKEQFTELYPYGGFKLTSWGLGEQHEVVPGLKAEVLYEGNKNGEMILTFSYGAHQILYMNISDDVVEKEILNKHDVKAEILKVADFATSGGTSQFFLDEINPHMAIIFSRRNIRPSQEIMERLNETWIDIYQIKQFGSITVRCDQENYEVITIPSKHSS